MGLLLSVIISYAGVNEAVDTIKHILSGLIPETDPDFQDFVDYYTKLLQKSANPSPSVDWVTDCGQGYLCLTEDDEGNLKSAAVKYYGPANSTAILFSTKISSFGQDSQELAEENLQANGDYRSERYTPTRTKTIITNTADSISVGYRNRSPTPSENISDPTPFSEDSFERDRDAEEKSDASEKLTWHYRPKSPVQPTLPEIQFQSFEDDKKGVQVYSDDYLRSRSRENSKERKNETWSVEASVDSVADEDNGSAQIKPLLKDIPKLGFFEEEKEETKETEVTEEEEEEVDDFWGNSGD